MTPPSLEIRGYILSCPVTEHPAIFEDEEAFAHSDLFQIIDPASFPEICFLTSPAEPNFCPDSVKLDAYHAEIGIPHPYHEYAGREKDLVHVFNLSGPDKAKGKETNQERLLYLYDLPGMNPAGEKSRAYLKPWLAAGYTGFLPVSPRSCRTKPSRWLIRLIRCGILTLEIRAKPGRH